MEKKIAVLLIFVLLGFRSTEQTEMVYDPTNAVKLGSVIKSLGDLKKLGEEWKSTPEFLNKIKNNAEEVKRFVRLMENIICLSDEMDLLLRASNGTTLCNRRLEFDLTLGKIEGINSRFSMLLNGAINMTQGETIRSLKDLNDELELAIRGSMKLNERMKRIFIQEMTAEYDKTEGQNIVTFQHNINL